MPPRPSTGRPRSGGPHRAGDATPAGAGVEHPGRGQGVDACCRTPRLDDQRGGAGHGADAIAADDGVGARLGGGAGVGGVVRRRPVPAKPFGLIVRVVAEVTSPSSLPFMSVPLALAPRCSVLGVGPGQGGRAGVGDVDLIVSVVVAGRPAPTGAGSSQNGTGAGTQRSTTVPQAEQDSQSAFEIHRQIVKLWAESDFLAACHSLTRLSS